MWVSGLFVFFAAAAVSPAPGADPNPEIVKHRMGTLIVRAAPGAKVEIEQLRHEFWFGATLPGSIFNGRASQADAAKFKEVFLSHFNAGVIESAFKWHDMERERGRVDYSTVDAMLEWAAKESIPLRGHCIFWGIPNRVQQWVKDLDDDGLRLALQRRGRSIAARYRGQFAEYDLNNEMIHANYYEDRLGPEVTKRMAQWVKEGDPEARLYLNDYDILTGRRLDDYVKHIRTLLDMGVPVAGIGVQGHLHGDSFDAAALKNALNVLGQFKLPVRVTEFNFPGQRSKYYTTDKKGVLSPEEERAKAEALKQYFEICFSHPAVTGILMWGFWEGANWIPQSSLYKRDWTPTPAAAAYNELVKGRWWTRWSGTADAKGSATIPAFFGRYKVTVDGKEIVAELSKREGRKVVKAD